MKCSSYSPVMFDWKFGLQVGNAQIRRDGLLQEGDQIVRINGEPVKNAAHAGQLFGDSTVPELLVEGVRLPFDLEDDDSVEELRMSLLEEFQEHHADEVRSRFTIK